LGTEEREIKFAKGIDASLCLYGGYDYISPQVFRVSTTAASLGTTFQWRLAQVVIRIGRRAAESRNETWYSPD
jgi:hypothetical protein